MEAFMGKTKQNKKCKIKVTSSILWILAGVIVFSIAIRLVIVGDFERPTNLTDYREEVAVILEKEVEEENPIKTKYTITIESSRGIDTLEIGKQDYQNLQPNDSIYILVSYNDIQLGTKDNPYTVIKSQE